LHAVIVGEGTDQQVNGKCNLNLSTISVPPHITPVVGPVSAVDGQIVTLTCEVEATPKPTITWNKDEAPLSSYQDEVMYLNDNATVRWVCYGSYVP
jgi:hypothetical protein